MTSHVIFRPGQSPKAVNFLRADRLLSILLLLQIHWRMTARELADKLEVSERTIHRDMEALSISGVPVMAERGTGGGWTLPKGYQTDLTGLSQPEIRSLFLGKPSRLMTDLGMHKVSETALTKLMAALPPIQPSGAEYARQRIYVDTANWRRCGEDISLLPTLQDAIWQERKLLFTYQRSEGSISERVADPLGLVAKGNIWYLVAAVAVEPRTYRVSRIRSATVAGGAFGPARAV